MKTVRLNFRGDFSKPHDLSEAEFNTLKKIGFLWEFYPDAPEIFPKQETEMIDDKLEIAIENLVVAKLKQEYEFLLDSDSHPYKKDMKALKRAHNYFCLPEDRIE